MSVIQRWRRLQRFLQHGIWHLPEQLPHGRKSFLLRLLRIVVLAARGFAADSLQLRASALTYYSLLSIVPALAMAFGVAKGFGLQTALERTLREQLAGQEEVLGRVIEFAHTMLENTRGGLVAGVGVLLLLWAVIRLLGNIERSFNAIWGVERGRSTVRKVTDYLAVTIFAPLLLLASSSTAVFISGRVTEALASVGVLEPVGGLVRAALELVPFVFIWLLLTLLYLTMPNTGVSVRAGLAAGVVAGTLYQLLQFGYIQFQIGVAKYNAIYGSFAALPLFLIWLYVSWLIVLVGAEVSFAVDNAGDYARERRAGTASHHQRRMLAMRLAVLCAGRFLRGDAPATASELADSLGVPARLVHGDLEILTAAGILAEVRGDDPRQRRFQPARDPDDTTLVDVAAAFDEALPMTADLREVGIDDTELVPDEALGEVATRWRELSHLARGADANATLAQLAAAEAD